MSLWVKDTAERVVFTFVQALLAVFGSDAVFDVLQVDWTGALTLAASAAVLALLKAVAARYKDDTVSPASLAPVDGHEHVV